MKENIHAPYVNRCLGVARQLLTVDTSNAFFESAYQDAAMLQLYYSWWHYTNEVLTRHQNKALSISVFELNHYLSNCDVKISEVNAIKQTLQQKQSWLQQILSYPEVIARPDLVEIKTQEEKDDNLTNTIKLIDIDHSPSSSINSDRVNMLIDLTTDFIHQQRELSLEY